MYVRGYLQGSENGRVVTIEIGRPYGNPNNPVVILRSRWSLHNSDRGRSIFRVSHMVHIKSKKKIAIESGFCIRN